MGLPGKTGGRKEGRSTWICNVSALPPPWEVCVIRIPVLPNKKLTNEWKGSFLQSHTTNPHRVGLLSHNSRLPWRPWLKSGIKISWFLKLLQPLVSFLCPTFSGWMFWKGSPSQHSPAQFSVTEHRLWAGSGRSDAKTAPSFKSWQCKGEQGGVSRCAEAVASSQREEGTPEPNTTQSYLDPCSQHSAGNIKA